MPRLQPGTLQYVQVPITVDGQGGGAYPVELALVPDGLLPTENTTWTSAEQATAGSVQILVGPGGTIDPDPGDYTIYVRVDADPEHPVLESGPITIM